MLRNRLPTFPDLLRVASVAAFFLFGWTIVAWMWQLPSWLLSLTLGEIASIFAYNMLTALSEVLTILIVILALTFLLPPRLFRDVFTVRATWLTIGLLAPLAIFFICINVFGASLGFYIFPWTIATLLLAALLTVLSARVARMRSIALWLADNLTIFLFLFIPLVILSVVTVIIRNVAYFRP